MRVRRQPACYFSELSARVLYTSGPLREDTSESVSADRNTYFSPHDKKAPRLGCFLLFVFSFAEFALYQYGRDEEGHAVGDGAGVHNAVDSHKEREYDD